MILLIDALGALGSIESFLLGQPRALLAAVRGRGNKTIEFYPPDGGCPGDVTRYLKARGIATWGWTGYLKQGEDANGNAEREPARITVSARQARWVELVMQEMGCVIVSPLADARSATYAANAQARGGLKWWRARLARATKPAASRKKQRGWFDL